MGTFFLCPTLVKRRKTSFSEKQSVVNGDVYASFLQEIISENESKYVDNSAYHVKSVYVRLDSKGPRSYARLLFLVI